MSKDNIVGASGVATHTPRLIAVTSAVLQRWQGRDLRVREVAWLLQVTDYAACKLCETAQYRPGAESMLPAQMHGRRPPTAGWRPEAIDDRSPGRERSRRSSLVVTLLIIDHFRNRAANA
jgi:hypothetical protein